MSDMLPNPGAFLRGLRPIDYLKISLFGTGLAIFWGSLHGVILPAKLQELVSPGSKNAYLGLLTFTGLVMAMLVQPLAGALSDRSALRWGQRRPFILLGTVLALAVLPGVAGSETFVLMLVVYCLLQAFANVAQAPFQAFIPDFVPPHRHGVASGVKSLMETFSVVIVLRLLAHLIGSRGLDTSQWLNTTLTGLGVVLFITMGATMFLVKEKRPEPRTHPPLLTTLAMAFRVDMRARRDFLWFLLSRLLILMALGTLQTFAFYYLSDYVGVSHPAAATTEFLIAVGGGMFAAVFPAAWLSDRVGRKPVLIVSGILGTLAVLFILLSRQYEPVLAASALLGASAGAYVSTSWALATDLVPPGEEAAYLGLTNVATAGAGAVARLIGPMIDFFNSRSPGLGYSVMLVACAVYFTAGTLIILKIGGRLKASPVPQNIEMGTTP